MKKEEYIKTGGLALKIEGGGTSGQEEREISMERERLGGI